MQRTPPKGAEKDAGAAAAPSGLHTGRLAAVTRKRHEIEALLYDIPSNLIELKGLFTVYLTRVEAPYDGLLDEHREWLQPHADEIAKFRARMDNVLYPKPATLNGTSRSMISQSSSVRLKLAEQSAKLQARKELLEKNATTGNGRTRSTKINGKETIKC